MRSFFTQGLRLTGLIVSFAVVAEAQIVFVDANLTTGLGDGSSWADAFQGPTGLSEALGVSTDHVFWVADGTYHPAGPSGDRLASFELHSNARLFGGFEGGEMNFSDRPPAGAFPSVLSGDLNDDDALGQISDNSRQVVTAFGDQNPSLNGFTVVGGNAGPVATPTHSGGGLFFDIDGLARITDCNFIGNRSIGPGAGAFLGAGPGNCTFVGCRFEGNESATEGGGLQANCDVVTLSDCLFQFNQAGRSGGGANVYFPGALRMTSCVFRDNVTAGLGGGAYFVGPDEFTIDGCTFAGNTAAGGGGLGVLNGPSSVFKAASCVVVDNLATGTHGGGGLFTDGLGERKFAACTIAGNRSQAQTQGGVRNAGSLNLKFLGCVLWGNIGVGAPTLSRNQVGSNVTVAQCIVEGGFPGGTAVLDLDPQFVDAVSGDYLLGAGSPAIDQGLNLNLMGFRSVDAAGAPRFRDDRTVPDAGMENGPLVDIGAFEFQADYVGTPVCAAVANSTGVPGRLDAIGSTLVSMNDVTLLATDMPVNQFALALFGGQLWGPQTVMGSIGTLCLIGPPLGRLQNQIQNTGSAGEATFATNLNALPGPNGPISVSPGETYVFQAWYRDSGVGAPSNFTTAVRISFE